MTDRLRRHEGMTLIEVMVTVLVVTVGALATLGTYVHFSGATNTARERAVLISVAQREMEQLKPVGYDQLGLSSAPAAAAQEDAPLQGRAATEALVTDGIVRPGGDPFSYQGATGLVYRYVTWRPQTCAALRATIVSQLANQLTRTQAEINAALAPDFCPASIQTKRTIVVVVPTDGDGEVTGRGVTLSSVRDDPEMLSLSTLSDDLKVKLPDPVGTPAASLAEAVSTQELYLTDTRCSEAVRQTPVDHTTRDTSQQGFTCTASGPAPKLMTPIGTLGTGADPTRDFSTDILRPLAPGGLALQPDTRGGECHTPSHNLVYTNAEAATRMKSVVTWASVVPSASVETPTTGGRASLTLWTSTTSGLAGAARLCVTVRRSSNGAVLGHSDFQLASWPGAATQLVTAFELGHAVLAPGERLLLTFRVPADSANGLRILYDHANRPSSLAMTLLAGKTY